MTANEIIKRIKEDLKNTEQNIDTMIESMKDVDMDFKAMDMADFDDYISRQAVQDYIAKYLSQFLYDDVREAVETIDEYIGDLPPVIPKPKTGHWKKMVSVYDMIEGKYRMITYTRKDEELGNPPFYVCDCGNNSKKPTNYCPDCGSYNGGDNNGNE